MAAAHGMMTSAASIRMPFGKGKKNSERLYAGKKFNFGRARLGISTRVKSTSNNDIAEIFEDSNGERGSPYSWPDKQKPRVCILGGGFGGLYTALRLESLVWVDNKKPQVVLVDKSENFVFKPLLYELLSGEVEPWEIAPSFRDLLSNTGVQYIKDKVKIIQPSGPKNVSSGGSIQLESGVSIEYDWLVLALGAEAKLDLVPGAEEYALPFSTLNDALKVDLALKKLERAQFGKSSSPIHVAIVGCGYSGVELAATISERLQDRGKVTGINVDTNICPTAPPGNREAALKVISERKIELLLGYYVNRIKKSDNHLKYVLDLQPSQRGRGINKTIEADLILWTVGSKSLLPQLESYDYEKRLPLTSKGQAEIEDTLQVKGHSRIFAVGDSAGLRDSSGRILPATAQVAFQQADFAGWNIWAAINDRPLLPFRFQNLGEMMTLGSDAAAVTPSFIDGLTLEGPIGHAARKISYLARLPTDEHRVKVGVSWLTKTAVDSIALLQSSVSISSGGEAAGVIAEVPKKESKFYETLFLSAMAGFGVMIGFSNGISLAKKKDEKAFNQGLLMLNDRPNRPQMETGARLAMRALGWGSLYAISGVGAISGLIWWLSGAENLKDFRQRMGELLHAVPKNNPPQGRTEFESFRDLFNYLAEESETKKAAKTEESTTEAERIPPSQQS